MRDTSHPPKGLTIWTAIAHPLSLLVGVVSLSMMLTAGVGLLMDSADGAANMTTSAAIAAGIAGLLFVTGRRGKAHIMNRREALLMVAVAWIVVGLVGAIPFVLGAGFSIPEAIFEAVSGFTTTGATVMSDISGTLDPALHFWRVLMHWLGGVGIIVLFVAVFPALGVGGRHLFYTEAAGPKSKGISPRIKERSSILWRVYLVITLVEIGALMLTGLSLYQATIHSLSTMGTGGFSSLNGSIGGFQNEAAEWIVLLFMLIAGTNIMLFYEAKTDGLKVFFKHAETRVYLCILGCATVACAWSIYGQSNNVIDSVRDGGFQVTALMTGTGFGTADYETWPSFSKLILVALFFVGGSSGSTAGGMKVFRVIVLVKAGVAELRRSFRPNLVKPLRIGGSVVTKEGVREVFTFCGMFAFTVIFGAIVVAGLDNYDGTTSLMASLACVANVGPGLGLVGPTDNYGLFSGSTKLFLSTLMILGRLEILAVAALLLPSFWSR